MKHTALLFLLLVGCDSTPGTPITPPLTTEAGVPTPASPLRTVGHRNPFGDVLQADNLMVDGDFELTGRNDQAPWVVFNQTQQTLNYDTGGRCRSGVRCAVIGQGDDLVGFLASPALGDFEVRIYLQPSSGHCGDAAVTTVDLSTNSAGDSIQPSTPLPDADGWCLFQGSGHNLAYEEPVLFVTMNQKSTTLHVDQASVLPVSEPPVHPLAIMTHAPPEILARAHEAAVWIHAHRKFGRRDYRGVP